MKQSFKKTSPLVSKRFFGLAGILSFVLTVGTMNVYAQKAYRLNQVIVLHDGNYLTAKHGVYATVGTYNPATNVYKDFDTIKGATFGSYVIIDSGYIYVGADTLLVKYDLNTKARIAVQTVVGIREMAIWGNQILVTCGTTYALGSYFQAYNKQNLQLIYRNTTVSNATQGIKVLNDSAYLAINGFWGTAQNLGVMDLKAQKEKHEINLDSTGLNPYDVEIEPSTKTVLTLNDLNFSNSTVTKYNAPSSTFVNTSLNLTSSCTGSAYYANNFYFQAGDTNIIGVYSTIYNKVFDSIKIGKAIYGLGYDSADGYLYVGQTDYFSFGNVFIYDLFGKTIGSFPVDVAPGNFAFDVRQTTGIAENHFSINMEVYPNPTNSELHIKFTDATNETATLRLADVLGRNVYQSQVNTGSPATISLGSFSKGVYFLTVETPNGQSVQKIVKE